MSRRSRSPRSRQTQEAYYQGMDKKTFASKIDHLVLKHKELEKVLKGVASAPKNHSSYVTNPNGTNSKVSKADYRNLSSQFVKELKDLKKLYNHARKKKKRTGTGNQSGNSPILISMNMARFFTNAHIVDPTNNQRWVPKFPEVDFAGQRWAVSTRNQLTRMFNVWIHSNQNMLQGDSGNRVGSAYINVSKSKDFMDNLRGELNAILADMSRKKAGMSPRRAGEPITASHFKSIYITKLLSLCGKKRADLDQATLNTLNQPWILNDLARDQNKILDLKNKYDVALAPQKEANRKLNQEQSKLKRSRRSSK